MAAVSSTTPIVRRVLSGHVQCDDWPTTPLSESDHGALGGDMDGQWPLRSTLQLSASPTAVACARAHADQVLWEWGLAEAAETAELLVSELVTNGIQAAWALEHLPPVWLRVSANWQRVLIKVLDGNTQPPMPPELVHGFPADDGERGRGLFLVTVLSERWGWYPSREPSGKVVWCELSAKPATPEHKDSESPTLLPKRTSQSQRNAQPARAMNNPQVLRRVQDGLRELDFADGR